MMTDKYTSDVNYSIPHSCFTELPEFTFWHNAGHNIHIELDSNGRYTVYFDNNLTVFIEPNRDYNES